MSYRAPWSPTLIRRADLPDLYRLAEEIARRGGLPPPGLFASRFNPPAAAYAEPERWRVVLLPRAFSLDIADMALLLAHEMGHLAHRHQPPPRWVLWFRPLALLALGGIAMWGAWLLLLPWVGAAVVREWWVRTWQRTVEREADEWAATIFGAAPLAMQHERRGTPRGWRRAWFEWRGYPVHRPWLHDMARREAEMAVMARGSVEPVQG